MCVFNVFLICGRYHLTLELERGRVALERQQLQEQRELLVAVHAWGLTHLGGTLGDALPLGGALGMRSSFGNASATSDGYNGDLAASPAPPDIDPPL